MPDSQGYVMLRKAGVAECTELAVMSNLQPGGLDMTHKIKARRYVSGSLMVVLISGCATWQPYSFPTAGAGELPATMRITRSDGERVVLNKPTIEADTALIGLTKKREPVHIPLREVVAMERSRAVGSVLAVAAIGLVGFAAVVAIAMADSPLYGPGS